LIKKNNLKNRNDKDKLSLINHSYKNILEPLGKVCKIKGNFWIVYRNW